jgi:hypothetical protein
MSAPAQIPGNHLLKFLASSLITIPPRIARLKGITEIFHHPLSTGQRPLTLQGKYQVKPHVKRKQPPQQANLKITRRPKMYHQKKNPDQDVALMDMTQDSDKENLKAKKSEAPKRLISTM